MRIALLVFNLDGMGGTSRSAITQANALAADHDVRLVSVTRTRRAPHYDIDARIAVDYLVDLRDAKAPATVAEGLVEGPTPRRCTPASRRWCRPAGTASSPPCATWRWRRRCRGLDVDVVVTVTPGLLATAVELLPDEVVVVHQEHRSSSDRSSGLEPLLTYAPRADVVALLTPTVAEWLRDQLGELAPEIVVMPNPLPLGLRAALHSSTAPDRRGRPAGAGEAVPQAGRRRSPRSPTRSPAGGCGSGARARSATT